MASELKVDKIFNAGGDQDTGINLATNDTIKFDIATSTKATMASTGIVTIVGEGGTNTTNLQQGLAKGWCHLTGTGTPTSENGLNIGSVTDTATGKYTLNFSNNFGNANYVCVCGMAGNDASTVTGRAQNVNLTPTTSAFAFRNILLGANSSTNQSDQDDTNILLALHGDLA